jgi:hypothetical protein
VWHAAGSEMAEFARAKLKFLKRFLKLKHSIARHVLHRIPHARPESVDAVFGRLTTTLVAAREKLTEKMMVSAYGMTSPC